MRTTLIHTSPERAEFAALRNLCILIALVVLGIMRPAIPSGEGGIGYKLEEFGVVILLAAITSGLIFHFMSRAKISKGKIVLTENVIEIELKSKTIAFKTAEISAFTIACSYDDVNQRSISLMSSYNNWISFVSKGKLYQYEFTVDSFYMDYELNQLTDYWKENIPGFELEVINPLAIKACANHQASKPT